MASPSNGSEHHLTCDMCSKDFDNPVTLKCLHSYCQSCIHEYISSRSIEIEANGYLNCPVCFVPTAKPDKSLHVSHWAEQLPSSQFLKCLADTISGKSSGDLCALCSEDKHSVKAALWCQNCHDGLCDSCAVIHGKMKVTKNHSTVPISSVSNQERNKSSNPLCTIHPEHCVEFYCDQCCEVLCQTCAIIDHRKCKDVMNVTSVARANRTDLHQTLNEIKTHVIMAEGNMNNLQIQSSKLHQSKLETDDEIKSYVNKLISRLRQSEQQILERFQKEYDISSCELTTREIKSKKTFTALRHVEKFIASVITMGSDADILNNTRLIENQKQRVVGNQTEVVEKSICVDLKFVPDHNLSSLIASGHIGSIKPRSSYKLKRIETHLDGESKGESCAIDLVVVSIKEEYIPIVIDGTNNCVKLLSEPPQNIQLRNPRRIEKLNNRAVIVTANKQVAFIDVLPRFQVSKLVEMQTDYTGIAAISGNRIAASRFSFSGGSFIDVLDFSGNVLQKLVLKDLLDPSYLSTTPHGNILVSDCRSKALTCLTHTGEIIFSYKSESGEKLKLPYGVCCSKGGYIYLADYNGARVVKLSMKGEYIEDCLTKSHGIDRPRGVAFDDEGLLYVCHCKGWINIFRIS